MILKVIVEQNGTTGGMIKMKEILIKGLLAGFAIHQTYLFYLIGRDGYAHLVEHNIYLWTFETSFCFLLSLFMIILFYRSIFDKLEGMKNERRKY